MPEPIVPTESIEVPPSEDNGNVPADSITPPNPAPTEPAPVAVTTEETTPAPEATLYELPDGRKVDAETLSREWKENFYPDYTRKSQKLAEVEKVTAPATVPPTTQPTNPLTDPTYVPQTYAELAKVIRESTIEELRSQEQARVDEVKAIEDSVASQLTEIKTTDPTLNEDALFLHATKFGFRDLKLAHTNMQAMTQAVKDTKTITAKDIQKRNDPVSIKPGANGGNPNPSNFSNAREYLRSLNGQ